MSTCKCKGCTIARKDLVEVIRNRIQERIDELASCHKKDECFLFSTLLSDYIDEWLEVTT